MKVLCTICARAGSKGLPNKNIKNLHGKPLIYYTVNHAIKSKIFDKILLSTDSERIKNVALKSGLDFIKFRTKKLSGDKIPKIEVIKQTLTEAEKFYKTRYDVICDLDVTSPLRSLSDIKKSFELFQSANADNLLSVCLARKNPYFNMIEFKNKKISRVKCYNKNLHSRQDAPAVYEMNASIYFWKRNILFSKNPFFRKKTVLFKMPFEKSIDIDSMSDWKIVKHLMK